MELWRIIGLIVLACCAGIGWGIFIYKLSKGKL